MKDYRARFPEAFERFESDVDVESFGSYMELLYAFQFWAGENWQGTPKQWKALNVEAERLGFQVPDVIRQEVRESWGSGSHVIREEQEAVTWRHEVVNVRRTSQDRYRDLRKGRFIKKPRAHGATYRRKTSLQYS
jgi:hypothetical protein